MTGTELAVLLENVVHERRHSKVLELPLVEPRKGVMLHYDDSSRDDWAVEWFFDKRCRNGYTWLVLDDGRVVELADPMKRTPHAGACRTPNANSAFYGIAAATNGLVPATSAQIESIVQLCLAISLSGLPREASFVRSSSRDGGRTPAACAAERSPEASHQSPLLLVGHDAEAIWTPANTRRAELWGKGGRKVDPTGVRKDGVPIIDVAKVRTRVAELLTPRFQPTA